jgi:hypothetical protein
MCLVEVEGSPKPIASCATQVRPDLKVITKSEKTRIARGLVFIINFIIKFLVVLWNFYLQIILWIVQYVIKAENVIFKISLKFMDMKKEDLMNIKEL